MSGNHILVAIDATVRAGQHRQEDGDDAIGGGHDLDLNYDYNYNYDLDLDYNYDFNYDYDFEYEGWWSDTKKATC